jgi:hypothetical protein
MRGRPGSDDHLAARLREREGRRRRSRTPALPDPSRDEVVLRPHSVGALVIELVAGALGLYVAVDGVRRGSVPVALIGLIWALALIAGGVLAFRRSTRLGVQGVTVTRVVSTSTLAWTEVSGFELLPHRTGHRDRVAAVTAHGPVLLEHGDSKSLVFRPELSMRWYAELVDRLESVRRRYV